MVSWSMKNWLWCALGLILLFAGLGVTAVGVFQPGLTCPDDDASAGCPATPFYSGMLGIGLAIIFVSIFSLVRAGKTQQLMSDAAVPPRQVPRDG